MTLCIAAQFRLKPPHVDEPMPAFVLCSDGRLSQGAWGSDDAAIKTHTLGYNFMALLAGSWPAVVDMGDRLSADFQNANPPADKPEVSKLIERSLNGFAASGLCPPKAHCESIVTGFVDKQPVIFRAEIKNLRPSVTACFGRDEIGEGAFAARMLLHHRGYDPLNVELATACYLVYEAKKFSENVGSVGPKTWIKIHTPIPQPTLGMENKAYCCMDVSEAGLKDLEAWRERFFLQSVAELKGKEFSRFLSG